MADVERWERTEEPSPRRRREARLDGRVARSPDLASAGMLLAAVAGLTLGGGAAIRSLGSFLAASLAPSRAFTDPSEVGVAAFEGLLAGASIVVPAACGLFAVAWIVGVGQVGLVFTARPLAPRPERLSPAANLANLASGRTPRRLATDFLKVAAVVGAVWWAVGGEGGSFVGLVAQPVADAAAGAGGLVLRAAFAAGAVLLAIGIVDWLLERRRIEGELRMTRREATEERREEEGDPAWRRRRAEFARGLAASPAVAIRQATALVADRDRSIAVAIEVPEVGEPRIVALGREAAAVRLVTLAAATGIPCLEDGPLAIALAAPGVRPGSRVPAAARARLIDRLAGARDVA